MASDRKSCPVHGKCCVRVDSQKLPKPHKYSTSKDCLVHGRSYQRTSSRAVSRTHKGSSSSRNEIKTRDSNCKTPRREQSIIVKQPRRKQGAKDERAIKRNTREPGSKNASDKTKVGRSASNLAQGRTSTKGMDRRDKKICQKHGVFCMGFPIPEKSKTEKRSSDKNKCEKKNVSQRNCHLENKHERKHGSPSRSMDRIVESRRFETSKSLSKPLKVVWDSRQVSKFIKFKAPDTIDLARREKGRKRSANNSTMVLSRTFVHVQHTKAPGKIFASDRLDRYDKYLLRQRILYKRKTQVILSPVSRWVNNETQEALRMLAKLCTNKIRSKGHLREVSLDRELNKLAGKHNYDQAYVIRRNETSHKGSDGKYLKERMKAVGYKSRYAFELLARGPESISEVFEYFMTRSCYRNMLLYHRISVMGIHGGRDSLGNWYWTLIMCG